MTFVIYTSNPQSPAIEVVALHNILLELFPNEGAIYSDTLDTKDLPGGQHYKIVVPGDNLISMLWTMKQKHVQEHCLDAVAAGADYYGFCAGAYLGAEHFIAGKSAEDAFFHFKENYKIVAEEVGEPLGMVEQSVAVGPFMPYEKAWGERGILHTHGVEVRDSTRIFNSMYMEGPLFLGPDLRSAYNVRQNVVANYVLDYHPKLTIESNGEQITPYLTSFIPAVLHQQVKDSHRCLIGIHPELAAQARTFVPLFNSTYTRDEIFPMRDIDKAKVMTEESEANNREFIRRIFTHQRNQ